MIMLLGNNHQNSVRSLASPLCDDDEDPALVPLADRLGAEDSVDVSESPPQLLLPRPEHCNYTVEAGHWCVLTSLVPTASPCFPEDEVLLLASQAQAAVESPQPASVRSTF